MNDVAGKKKGMSPLAWILIGCGGVAVIGLVVLVVGGLFIFQKGKELVEDYEANPELATAKMMAAVHPEIELVDSDPNDDEVLFRNSKTGEEVIVDMKAIREGRFQLKDVDGKTVFAVEPDPESGSMTVTTAEGRSAYLRGDVALPQWLEAYPGTEARSILDTTTDEMRGGMLNMQTSDAIEDVLVFFEKSLGANGLSTEVSRFGAGETKGGTVKGRSDDGKREITISASAYEDLTNITVQFTERF